MPEQAPISISAKSALAYFFCLASQHTHYTAQVAARLLLSCYNGSRFLFNLSDLRTLDDMHLRMALQIIQLDARPTDEVHELLNQMYQRTDFGHRFEHLAWRFDLPGKCSRRNLAKLEPVSFAHPLL